MQVDDLAAAGAMMQSIDVLGDQRRHRAGRFECRERRVGAVRPRICDPRPPGEAACPVALANLGPGDEVGVLHGPGVLPVAVPVAVVGDAGRRADARAGNNRNAACARDEAR
jgi:hypothetical protein